ncbi:MAG TPA: hypothetical protein VGB15_03190 [Longimicrobium sp.]
MIKEQIKPLRPAISRKIPVPLRIQPRSGRVQLVGIAFDYLLRFELQQRSAKAWGPHWVADHAPEMLRRAHRSEVQLRVQNPEGGPPLLSPPPGGFQKASRRAQKVLDAARDAVADYLIGGTPTPNLSELAAHALRIARLDLIYRAGFVDPDFDRADLEDIEDLLAMLAAVPFNELAINRRILLNPTFGSASLAVGGGDADLIIGDLLLDVKTTKQDTIRAEFLDQLFGYFLLARQAHRDDRRFPKIRRVGLYFARHAFLCVMDTKEWTGNPAFPETEKWFFERAKALT